MIKTILKAIGLMLLGACIAALVWYEYNHNLRIVRIERAVVQLTNVVRLHQNQIAAIKAEEPEDGRRGKR